MLQNLTGWHALIVLAIVILIFGAAKLPALARSIGQSVRILKTEAAEARTDDAEPATATSDTATRTGVVPVLAPPSTT